MNDAIVAILDKMHSALSHIPDVLPSMSGMRVQLGSIRADIDRLRDQLAPEAEAVVQAAETDAHRLWGEDAAAAPFMPADAPPTDALIPVDTVDGPVVDPVPATGKKSPAAAAAAAAKS